MARALFFSLLISAGLVALLARGLALEATHPVLAAIILVLFAITTAVLAFSAITALVGLRAWRHETEENDASCGRCAVLWLVCGEPPEPLARRVEDFLARLNDTGQDSTCDVFVLSDTQDGEALAREQAALAPLLRRIIYRNRPVAQGRKPGNLQDWLTRWGAEYDTMLVLDADSGFCPLRLGRMRAQMAAEPRLGLIQAAIRLRPTQSRFGAMQRLSARLSGPVFARGLARLSGGAGNYWGHNALIRVRAFAEVTPLPDLGGRPPFGGPVLSHDFIEAACLIRAGWKVVLYPDSRGSFEDAPETIGAYLRRDRRWAQGNLQHLRLLASTGLHPTSRLHLLSGILSYLTAPFWFLLVLLTGSGAVHATAGVIWPLLGVMALLLVPKLSGLVARRAALRHPARRRVLLRGVWAELGLTTLFAPLGMLRRCGFVVAVFAGRATAWVPSGQAITRVAREGRSDALGGLGIIVAVAAPQLLIAGGTSAMVAALLVLPVALPLLSAPRLWRWFEAVQVRNPVARYYDRSTRRFLSMGGSGAALAIHRPLWAEGVSSHVMAAGHVNCLIAAQAEAALGSRPLRVVDLGCGVGGTVFHLAERWPEAELCGITLSAEQVRLAEAHARARGVAERCQFLRSDFLLPTTLPRADLVIAVESHVHAPDAAAFLAAAMRHLQPGGVLVLVDDMLAGPEVATSAAPRIAQILRGWRLGHIPDSAGLVEAAREEGLALVEAHDLTGLLRLDRLRDRGLRLVGPVADRLGLARYPVFGNMIGGNALTESYRAGQMRYQLMVFRHALPAQQVAPVEAVA